MEGPHGRSVAHAARQIKRDQITLVPVVVIRATSNVPPPVRRAPAMELGDRYSEYEKRKISPSIPSDNPQTRRPMPAFPKGTCRLVPNVEVLQCATWLEFLKYTGIRKYENNRSLQNIGT